MGLIYELHVPSPSSFDVASRVIRVTINGIHGDMPLIVTESTVLTGPVKENSKVSVQIQDIDHAGNHSEWSEPYEFVAVDTLPPPQPGKVSAVLISQVPDDIPPAISPTVVEGDAVVVAPAEVAPIFTPNPEPPQDSDS